MHGIAIGVSAVSAAAVGAASARVTNGFVENFASGTGGFSGGGMAVSNPGTGGIGGDGDGFLRIDRAASGRFAVRSIGGPYAGDYAAGDVEAVTFWLQDLSGFGFEVRVGVGNNGNFWVSNGGFVPVQGEWTRHFVELTDESLWTRVRGSGSFEDALANADRLQFRHEVLPIEGEGSAADNRAGTLGVDRIAFVPAPGAAGVMAVAGVVAGRRRR